MNCEAVGEVEIVNLELSKMYNSVFTLNDRGYRLDGVILILER